MLTINLLHEDFSASLNGSYLEGITVNYGGIKLVWNKVIAEDIDFTFKAEEDGSVSLRFSKTRGESYFEKSFILDNLNLTDDSFYSQIEGFTYSINYYYPVEPHEPHEARQPLGSIITNDSH